MYPVSLKVQGKFPFYLLQMAGASHNISSDKSHRFVEYFFLLRSIRSTVFSLDFPGSG